MGLPVAFALAPHVLGKETQEGAVPDPGLVGCGEYAHADVQVFQHHRHNTVSAPTRVRAR